MPNWCEGNIRLRGTKECIKSFFENELYFTMHEAEVPVVVEESFGDLTVSRGKDYHAKAYDSFRIKNAERTFIKGSSFEVYAGVEPGEVATACVEGFRAAWNIEADPYIEKAKRYGVDIKIYAIESGSHFVRTIEIIRGELKKDETMRFGDWDWECPFPKMGG